jgi:peroxiredoxin
VGHKELGGNMSATSNTHRFVRVVAIVAYAVAVFWIAYEWRLNSQGSGAVSLKEMGDAKVNQPAPDFSVLDLAGNKVSLADYRGKKVVLLDFWATWCVPCQLAMEGLQPLEDKYKGHGLEILSLNQGEPVGEVRQFINHKKYDFHVLLDTNQSVALKYGAGTIPAFVLVDKNGIIRRLQLGYDSNDTGLQQAIERLLKQS